jgi:hypothetical protein
MKYIMYVDYIHKKRSLEISQTPVLYIKRAAHKG